MKIKYLIACLLGGVGYAQVNCSLPMSNASTFNFTTANNGISGIYNASSNIIASNQVNATTYLAPEIRVTDGFLANPSSTSNVLLSIANCSNCATPIDLFIKDGPTDDGNVPNNNTLNMWTSTDIWVGNENNDIDDYINPTYGISNFLKVRVKNNGCGSTTGTESLELRWAKASTSLTVNTPWFGDVFFNGNGAVMGGLIGTITLPIMVAGEERTFTFPWNVPNPADYGNIDQWHFCVMAKALTSAETIADNGMNDLNWYVRNNNNIAWRNLHIINVSPASPEPPTGVVEVGNTLDEPRNCYLELLVEDMETGKPIYEEAEVTIKMDETLYHAWVKGNKETEQLFETNMDNIKLVKGNQALIKNILFDPHESGTIRLDFNFLTEQLTNKTKYIYHLVQKESGTDAVIGGETFYIKKQYRPPFEAGSDDLEIDKYETIMLNAQDIGEPAIYNWYDSEGHFIAEGKDLQVANAVAEKYKLEVISTADGFKDYSNVEVKLKPSRLSLLYPNPTSSTLNVKYKINEANSAYLSVYSYYVSNSAISNNYIIDLNAGETNIDVSQYPNGFYKVALITDGKVVDIKILNKTY
ncbi:hypothetical protein B0A58_11590 [Flavobacterium branchiophilum NBRC 15030 = ATCC 35035]|uniref:Secretion system C-terminal sorting domain-containing protein n=1 Tax=Flavobacterium branchiophilum TaxID=55197 RepID=A0A543G238_9FLAO|nr:T9SS type A sorting domain-containing protein [Flavobacterium branchiophilum]OXA73803.1 hypothetical protein B0A58_11590 [Flavobacterium branchiophilum NBRC 15030 = ATCC 35035]TQM40094.1 hypothetical protein BC670_0958 [Flavobacterium branchiophilum]GEM55911.1 hypothetical protein FB1_21320 [Flavobacterium branchiophilum NBRC 15030 = ATCC 35035]